MQTCSPVVKYNYNSNSNLLSLTPGSKEFMLCIATPPGIIAPKGMILQVLGNLYGLPSSGRNFSKAVDLIVAKCGYKSTPYDLKFFCKWIDGMPI